MSGEKIKYEFVAGYHQKETDVLSYPQIFVRRMPASLMPKSQIKGFQRLFAKTPGETFERELKNETGLDAITNLNINIPYYEEKTGIVWMKMKMDLDESIAVEVLSANFYHEEYVFQFTAATTEEYGVEDWPLLEKILRNVSFKKEPKEKILPNQPDLEKPALSESPQLSDLGARVPLLRDILDSEFS